jgi:hypothetical protein
VMAMRFLLSLAVALTLRPLPVWRYEVSPDR